MYKLIQEESLSYTTTIPTEDVETALDIDPTLPHVKHSQNEFPPLVRNQQRPDQGLQPHHQLILELITANGYVTNQLYATQTPRAKATCSLDFKK